MLMIAIINLPAALTEPSHRPCDVSTRFATLANFASLS